MRAIEAGESLNADLAVIAAQKAEITAHKIQPLIRIAKIRDRSIAAAGLRSLMEVNRHR